MTPDRATNAGLGDGPKQSFDFYVYGPSDAKGNITLRPVLTADDVLSLVGATGLPFREARAKVLEFRASPGGQGMPPELVAELLDRALVDG